MGSSNNITFGVSKWEVPKGSTIKGSKNNTKLKNIAVIVQFITATDTIATDAIAQFITSPIFSSLSSWELGLNTAA